MKPAWTPDDMVELLGAPELVRMLGLRPYQNLSDITLRAEFPKPVRFLGSVRWRKREVLAYIDKIPVLDLVNGTSSLEQALRRNIIAKTATKSRFDAVDSTKGNANVHADTRPA